MLFRGEFPRPQNPASSDPSLLEILKTLLMAHKAVDSGMDSTGN